MGYARPRERSYSNNGYYRETYRSVQILVEQFRDGWNVRWNEGGQDHYSACWNTSQAAVKHAKRCIDRYNRVNK
jgi:hypothetical protein